MVVFEQGPKAFCGVGPFSGRMGDAQLELLAEVRFFPIPDGVSTRNQAVIGLASSVIAAINADVEIGTAVRASGAKPNLNRNIANLLSTLPTVHETHLCLALTD